LGALVADFLTGKFPVITEDRQIQTLDSNIQGNGMKTALEGQFEATFYKNIDLDDMLKHKEVSEPQRKELSQLFSSLSRHIFWI
jgi:hypothetical protein